MPKRSKSSRQTTDEPQQPTPAESRYHVDHYGKSRNFAAYDRGNLIAVTLYRKGAEEVTKRLTEKDHSIAALESQLAALQQQAPPPPSAAEAAPAWTPPRQLDLIAAEDITLYRITSQRRRPAPAPRRS